MSQMGCRALTPHPAASTLNLMAQGAHSRMLCCPQPYLRVLVFFLPR